MMQPRRPPVIVGELVAAFSITRRAILASITGLGGSSG